jgi:hypothetical protein
MDPDDPADAGQWQLPHNFAKIKFDKAYMLPHYSFAKGTALLRWKQELKATCALFGVDWALTRLYPVPQVPQGDERKALEGVLATILRSIDDPIYVEELSSKYRLSR